MYDCGVVGLSNRGSKYISHVHSLHQVEGRARALARVAVCVARDDLNCIVCDVSRSEMRPTTDE